MVTPSFCGFLDRLENRFFHPNVAQRPKAYMPPEIFHIIYSIRK